MRGTPVDRYKARGDAKLFSVPSRQKHMKENEEMPSPFPDDVLEHALQFITSHKDRNAVSQVCKAWHKVESYCRQHVFIGNCYAVSPERLVERFPNIRSVTLKGKPRFADFDLLPPDWGAHVLPWITAFADAYPFLEELRLKRMTVSDESLLLIGHSFSHFKSLILISCDGFSSDGLAMVTGNCKHLTQLDLTENAVIDESGTWLSNFPETCTSLVSLNFENLQSEVEFEALEKLVSRSKALRTLKLNRSISLSQLQSLLFKAAQLTELGTGSFFQELTPAEHISLQSAFGTLKELRSLSGFWEVSAAQLPAIYPVCSNLLSLNLSYSPISDLELSELVSHCHRLQRLWLMDSVEDKGLFAVASTCKDLRDLRVYPMNREGQRHGVSEEGLVSISEGCPNLSSILYFCVQMTNAAMVVMAKNCPLLVSFRLCILEPYKRDHMTGDPMDDGFGAILKHCKELRRLALSGLLTDKAFEYIGTYGKQLERLSVAFAGESDIGLQHVLRGCTNMRKLEIRDSPFGDMALLSGVHRYESMRSLWMSSCTVTLQGCNWLARQKPRLNVEVIRKNDRDSLIESLYVYRSVLGPRKDTPPFVVTL
eukprot:c27171_g2_i3 orf=738-2528(-)